jgi:hypothetical protein
MLSVAVVVLAAADVVAQAKPSLVAPAKPSFAGDWMMVGPDGRGDPDATVTITQSATAMTLAYIGCGQAPMPVKFTYKLDGSVSKNMMAGRGGGAPTEQVSRGAWAGNKIVVTTTTGPGEEKRTFSMDGGNLVVETSAPARNGGAPNVTKVTYTRYECGHGG